MKYAMLFVLSTALCVAQDDAKRESKLIKLKNTGTDSVVSMLGALGPHSVGRYARVNNHTVILTGPPEAVAMMEALIKQLDAPPAPARSVEITAYMVLGVTQAGEANTPADLAPVVKQLREVFPFAGYRLLETMQIRTEEGKGGETSGLMPGPSPIPQSPVIYQCRFNRVFVSESTAGRRIQLENLKFGTKVPYSTGEGKYNYVDLGANVDSVSLREGQKAVIGKAGIGAGKESLFLVLNAKLVD